jgi:hypothetical protein
MSLLLCSVYMCVDGVQGKTSEGLFHLIISIGRLDKRKNHPSTKKRV